MISQDGASEVCWARTRIAPGEPVWAVADLVLELGDLAGWLGKILDVLGGNLSKIQHEHEEKRKRWSALREDLVALRPFKERIATVRLLQRTAELAPIIVARIEDAKKALQTATDRAAAIVASCDRDIETGRLLIPNRFAKEYPDQLHKRDQNKAQYDSLASALIEAHHLPSQFGC